MRTMHSVLKHGGLYWDKELAPASACEQRFRRVQQAVAESGDDAWLLFGDIERHGNLTYATNFLPRVRSALAFMLRQGQPILLANIGLRDVPATKIITWVEDMRPFGRLPKALTDLLEQQGLQKARIGTCGFDRLPLTEWEAIEKALPEVRWTGRDECLMQLRASKEAWEIDVLRRSSDIAAAALAIAPEVLRPGTTIRQAIAAIDRQVRRQGAEDARYLIGVGDGQLRPVDDRPLAAGDIITVYMTVEAQRYWAETTRTFVLGATESGLRDLFGQAQRALAAMAAAVRGGAPAADVARAARTVLGDALYRSAALYGLGHGIGLDADEDPILAETSTATFAEDATVAARVILRDVGRGVGLSQMLIARQNGAEPIDKAAPLVEIRP